MTIEHDHARELLAVLRHLVLTDQPPIRGYHRAAEAIGLDGERYQRHMGQVCSRIDVATFNAGYPMLATHMVRTPEGEIHPDAFRGQWEQFRDECTELVLSHRWTPEQLDEVLGALNALGPVGAISMWNNIREREAKKPGYIRYNLHRKVKPKPKA